jgi:hypothetical protein
MSKVVALIHDTIMSIVVVPFASLASLTAELRMFQNYIRHLDQPELIFVFHTPGLKV